MGLFVIVVGLFLLRFGFQYEALHFRLILVVVLLVQLFYDLCHKCILAIQNQFLDTGVKLHSEIVKRQPSFLSKKVPYKIPVSGLSLLAVLREYIFQVIRGTLAVFEEKDFDYLCDVIAVLKIKPIFVRN